MVRSLARRLVLATCLVAMWLCLAFTGLAYAGEPGDGAASATQTEDTATLDDTASGNAANAAVVDAADEGDGAATSDETPSSTDENGSEGASEGSDVEQAALAGEANEPGADDNGSDAADSETSDTDEPVTAEPEETPAPEATQASEEPAAQPTATAAPAAAAATATKAATATSATAKVTTSAKAAATKAKAKKASSSAPLADGTYVLNFMKSQQLMVGVKGSTSKAAQLQMQKDGNKKAQRWIFTWVEKYQAYFIQNAKSKLYVTTKAAQSGKDLVWQKAKSGKYSKNQLWKLQKSGKGYKVLSAANGKLAFGTWSGKLLDGYFVTLRNEAAKKQAFYILPVDNKLKKPAGETPDTIVDGKVYSLANANKSSLYMEQPEADATNGVSPVLASKASATDQKWLLKAAADGTFQIVNVATNKALQVKGNHRYNGAEVGQAASKASNQAQQWWIRENSDGSLRFVNRMNGLTLSLSGSSVKKGAAFVTSYKPAAKVRDYKVKQVDPIDAGIYEISMSQNTDRAITVPGFSTTQGVQLKTADYSSLISQKFLLTRVGAGQFKVRSQYSSRYLAEDNGKVVQGATAEDKAQLWEVVFDNGKFYLKNVESGNYLKVAKDNTKKSAALTTVSSKPGTFTFISRHTIDDGSYFIQPATNKKQVLGMAAGKATADKAKQFVYKKKDDQSYKYHITYLGKDSSGREMYKIVNALSNKALTSSGSSVYQLKYKGSKSQKWGVDISKKGGVVFVNEATGKALNSKGSNKAATAAAESLSSAKENWNVSATVAFTGLQLQAYKKIAKNYSKTNYAIAINLSDHYLWVFERKTATSPWTLKYEWRCSNGAKITPTPAVNLLLSGAKRYKNPKYNPESELFKSSFYYMTYIANGKYIHTPLYQRGSTTKYRDKRMGRSISHGCVRVPTANAIWVYKNIKKGTRCITYY